MLTCQLSARLCVQHDWWTLAGIQSTELDTWERRMDKLEKHYLFCLLNQSFPEKLPSDVLHDAISLLKALVDRHGANLQAVPSQQH